MSFRDDAQATRACGALVAPLPFQGLWSATGPTRRARVFLDRRTRSAALGAGEQLRLFVAGALWRAWRAGGALSWAQARARFERWAPEAAAPGAVEPEIEGDVRELVEAVARGPAAVDGWLLAYARAKAPATPSELLWVLAFADRNLREGKPYPTFADLSRWTGLPVARARALLEQLEALGWLRPPEVAHGKHRGHVSAREAAMDTVGASCEVVTVRKNR